MVIATDGQPDDMASARAMIQSAKDDDIIVIGIGFGDANDSMMKSLLVIPVFLSVLFLPYVTNSLK
ncbi:VWA domain-containing protein [Klebsiella michiganensis]|uniref:VWA domain-containing protein n=1 Tax=Klebsiella michiganensis TaxID=1134687 RepID=UPI002A35F087|nr:VWA domain-containing protein [Klebsiella michiganensis]